jgi:thiamine-monophosphate kinase
VGGDLSASDTLTLAVTAFGDLQGREPVLRSGARPGHVVAVAGELGAAGAGLTLLFRHGVDADGIPDAVRAAALRRQHPQLVGVQLAPSPPIALGPVAAQAGATAMMDLSDGLAIDAGRLARASSVGIDFDSTALIAASSPLMLDQQSGRTDQVEAALGGGEDHGLLAAFPPDAVLPAGFRAIGRVTEHPGVILVDGVPHIQAGWDPYRGWNGAAG